MRIADDVGNVFIWSLAVVIVVFVVAYTSMTKGRSWTTGIGASMQAAWLCVLIIIVPSLLVLTHAVDKLLGTIWYQWVAIATLGISLCFAVTHLVSIVRLQIKGENKQVKLKEENK